MRMFRFAGPVAVLLFGLAAQARAGFVTDTLGSAGPSNYAILSIGTGNSDVALNGPGTTTGNVGVLSGTLSLNGSAGPEVNGNVFLGSGANISTGNGTQVTGSVFTGQSGPLTQARTDAINASNTFAALAPTTSVPGGAINGNTTINGTAGVNVLNVSGINLGNGQALTLNGPAGSQFVINDSGNLVLNSGHINLTGGLTPSDVVINDTASGNAISASGGLNNESVVNGILLAPNSGIAFAPGLINGEAIAGGNNIHFVSGAEVHSPPSGPPVVPAPSSLVLMGLGGLAFLGVTVLSGRRRTASAL